MADGTYRRPQMEAALWSALSARMADDPRGHSAPPVFLNRIKRLLELDTKKAANIFAGNPASGSGNAAAYEPFGIFLMALGLVCLDAGFKQSDTIFVLRHLKDELRPHYEKIAASNIDLHQQLFTSDRPGFPHLPNKPMISDQQVFMTIAKYEMRECWSGENLPDPFFAGPTFCYGLTELQDEATHIDWQRPSRFIVEIAGLVTLTRRHLFRNELFEAWAQNTGQKVAKRKSGRAIVAPALKSATDETAAQSTQPRFVRRTRRLIIPKRKPAAS